MISQPQRFVPIGTVPPGWLAIGMQRPVGPPVDPSSHV
jgi:hypothetical protein